MKIGTISGSTIGGPLAPVDELSPAVDELDMPPELELPEPALDPVLISENVEPPSEEEFVASPVTLVPLALDPPVPEHPRGAQRPHSPH